MVAIFIEKPTPFLEEFLIRTSKIDYPRDKIDLFIHNSEDFHANDIEDFIREFTFIRLISSSAISGTTKLWFKMFL